MSCSQNQSTTGMIAQILALKKVLQSLCVWVGMLTFYFVMEHISNNIRKEKEHKARWLWIRFCRFEQF